VTPKLMRILRWVGYPLFYIFALLLFTYLTFPYYRLKDRLVGELNAKPISPGMQVKIDSVDSYWLSGVEAEGVQLISTPAAGTSAPDGKPFRFERRASATPPARALARRPPAPVEVLPTGPLPPPPPPPIPLRFIGYLQPSDAPGRVAVLSDGRGNVFNGKEGDVIEGRYRLLRVGDNSADLIYLDGRGRQTIRLSGQ
jgi:hypothetical protein